MLEICNLSLTYPGAGQASVRGVSLRVEKGEFVTLLGPSGCGKTSTLRSVAGLESPSDGTIRIGAVEVFDAGRSIDVPTHTRDISMVFQSYAVWPHMSVRQNVAFPLEVAAIAAAECERRVAEALEMVGLSPFATRSATQLSGGQQQRVAIARALVRRSAVMLLDEPLSNLDAKLREQMRLELRHLLKSVGLTAVYVTHDQEEALALSDRIALMDAGKIVEVGSPRALYLHPQTRFAAQFLGAAEILRASGGAEGHVQTELGPLQFDGNGAAFGHVGIRPEAIVLHCAPAINPGAPNRFEGQLVSVVFSGRQQQVQVRLAGGRVLQVLTDPLAALEVGAAVSVELPPARLMGLKDSST